MEQRAHHVRIAKRLEALLARERERPQRTLRITARAARTDERGDRHEVDLDLELGRFGLVCVPRAATVTDRTARKDVHVERVA